MGENVMAFPPATTLGVPRPLLSVVSTAWSMLDDFSTGMFRPDNLVISNLDGIDFRQLFENPSTVRPDAC